MTITEIQEKIKAIKEAFVSLANQFEAETGTHLHLSVHHKHSSNESEILTCEVKVPDIAKIDGEFGVSL